MRALLYVGLVLLCARFLPEPSGVVHAFVWWIPLLAAGASMLLSQQGQQGGGGGSAGGASGAGGGGGTPAMKSWADPMGASKMPFLGGSVADPLGISKNKWGRWLMDPAGSLFGGGMFEKKGGSGGGFSI